MARGFQLRHPLISGILTQINFWILAYLLFFVLLYFISLAVSSLFAETAVVHLLKNITIGIITAIIFGIALGIIDFFVERKFRGKSLGIEVLFKGLLYLIAWIIVGRIAYLFGVTMNAQFVDYPGINYTNKFSGNIFYAITIYTVFIIIIISFIKEMNRKFGPGILLPMFFGRFRKPRVEERIFLFMDLKDSTTYAEKLGNIKYSQMIQDCFLDVNKTIPPFNAEIYQYVGDEVVLTWEKEDGLKNSNCIKFFEAFQIMLNKRRDHYESKYGFVPQFKAGAHVGEITVAEVGDFKREIAYHGDTINTASRIQSVCNTFGKSFLISEKLQNNLKVNGNFETEKLDSIVLKGKEKKVALYSVSFNLSD